MEERRHFEIGSLRSEELDVWYDFCGRVFQSADAAYFRAHFENDPDARSEDIFVAREAGKIVSSVRLFTRSAFLRGRMVRVGGIGEVCTAPDARGNGLSTRLLTLAMEKMDERGWELGMLYGVLQSHYGRQGFADAAVRHKQVRLEDLPPVSTNMGIRPLIHADLDAVMGLYDLYTSQFDMAYRREKRAYWEKWVMHEWKNPVVLLREGQVVAYADTVKEKDALVVREAGAVPDDEAALGMLLRQCALTSASGAVILPSPVLRDMPAQPVEKRASLMVRFQRTALGFASRDELLRATEHTIVQWETDDY